MKDILRKYVGESLNALNYKESFTCRYNINKDKLFIKSLKIPTEIVEDLKINMQSKLDSQISAYDPEGNDPEHVIKIEASTITQHKPIVNALVKGEKGDSNYHLTISNEDTLPSSDRINFIIHKFAFQKAGKEKILLSFSKHEKSNILNKVFIKSFNKDEFKKIEKERHYVFKNDITFFLYNDNYYIYKLDPFLGIFSYWEKLKEVRDKIVKFMEDEKLVSNLSTYRETFEKHYNMKSMVKIDILDAKQLINRQKKDIAKVCMDNDLSLGFDPQKKQFTINSDEGVTNLNRILSKRSGHNLEKEFVTFPSYVKHKKSKKK